MAQQNLISRRAGGSWERIGNLRSGSLHRLGLREHGRSDPNDPDVTSCHVRGSDFCPASGVHANAIPARFPSSFPVHRG